MRTRLVAETLLALVAIGLFAVAAQAADSSAHGAADEKPTAEAPEAPGHGQAEGEHGKSEGEHEGGGAAGLNPINFHGMNFPGDMALWTAIVFVVVLLILWKAAWGPIAEGLTKREQQIAAQIAQAEQSNVEARQLLADYQQKLSTARDEVRAILEQGRRDAEQLGHQLIEKAKGEAATERDRSLAQIEAATGAALKELAERSATLAVQLAGKIVRTKLEPKDHARLIEEAVKGFTGKGSSKT